MNDLEVLVGPAETAPTDLTTKETEITAYSWPGFLAELDHGTGVFVVRELL